MNFHPPSYDVYESYDRKDPKLTRDVYYVSCLDQTQKP